MHSGRTVQTKNIKHYLCYWQIANLSDKKYKFAKQKMQFWPIFVCLANGKFAKQKTQVNWGLKWVHAA